MSGTHSGVPYPATFDSRSPQFQKGWEDGVDAALASANQKGSSVLRLTGWTKRAVLAFGHVAEDNADTARQIVRDMSPRDSAVLSHLLRELSEIVDDEELSRRQEDRRRARLSRVRDTEPDELGQVDG